MTQCYAHTGHQVSGRRNGSLGHLGRYPTSAAYTGPVLIDHDGSMSCPDGPHVSDSYGLLPSTWGLCGHISPSWSPTWGQTGARIDYPCGAQIGPMCLTRNGPLWPPGQFCLGHAWAAHKEPKGPPTWGPSVARMDCPCGGRMGQRYGPDGSHVYRPYGLLVAPWPILPGPVWAACMGV